MKKVLMIFLFILTGYSLTGCSSSETRQAAETAVSEYNEAAREANQAVSDYNEAVDALASQNEKLDEAIRQAQETADEGGIPFDEATLLSLKEEIESADELESEIPEKLTLTYDTLDPPSQSMRASALQECKEEAENMLEDLSENPVPDPPVLPDYAEEIKALETAASAYEDSVAGYALVLSPAIDYVIERLRLLDTVTDIEEEPADEKETGADDGCQGCVYFVDSRVDRYALYTRGEEPRAAETGVKGGGCVKIYETEEQAQERDEELTKYDRTIFGGGAHRAVGAMLIQISELLSTEEQLKLEDEITEALLRPAV